MTKMIRPQPGILDIALYRGGRAHIAGRKEALKLSSNENPRGPSPKTVEAFRGAAFDLHRYPSTDHLALRTAIGEVHSLDPERIICGVGSDEVLQMVAQAYAGPGDEVVLTEHGFSMYPILAHMVGATPVEVRERERVVDVDAILDAITERTRVVFVANPANPTGTVLGDNEIKRLAAGLPSDVILVHDGAYAEYAEDFDGGVALADAHPNVVMTRTFSKIYGLGGLRIGWGYAANEIIDVLNRVRQPFNLSNAQLAAAEAAVRDTVYTEACRAENGRLREWLRKALADIGIPSDQSHTNFVLARFRDSEAADTALAHLEGDGILVRGVAGYKLPHCLRITVGTEADCRRVVTSLKAFMERKR